MWKVTSLSPNLTTYQDKISAKKAALNSRSLRESERRKEDIYEELPLFQIEKIYGGTPAGEKLSIQIIMQLYQINNPTTIVCHCVCVAAFLYVASECIHRRAPEKPTSQHHFAPMSLPSVFYTFHSRRMQARRELHTPKILSCKSECMCVLLSWHGASTCGHTTSFILLAKFPKDERFTVYKIWKKAKDVSLLECILSDWGNMRWLCMCFVP